MKRIIVTVIFAIGCIQSFMVQGCNASYVSECCSCFCGKLKQWFCCRKPLPSLQDQVSEQIDPVVVLMRNIDRKMTQLIANQKSQDNVLSDIKLLIQYGYNSNKTRYLPQSGAVVEPSEPSDDHKETTIVLYDDDDDNELPSRPPCQSPSPLAPQITEMKKTQKNFPLTTQLLMQYSSHSK
ncbi:MAG: hypothetical protein WBQ73_02530 [Candidatus Babeliales bacterium]